MKGLVQIPPAFREPSDSIWPIHCRRKKAGSVWESLGPRVFWSTISPGLDFLLFTLGRGMSPHGAACYQDQIKELWNSLKDSKSHRNTKHYLCGNDLQILLSLDLSCIGSKYLTLQFLTYYHHHFLYSLWSWFFTLFPAILHPLKRLLYV